MTKPIVTKAGPFWRWDVPENTTIITKARLTSEVNRRRQDWLSYWLGHDERFRMMVFGFLFFGVFAMAMAAHYNAPMYNGISLFSIGVLNIALRVFLITRARRRTRAVFS